MGSKMLRDNEIISKSRETLFQRILMFIWIVLVCHCFYFSYLGVWLAFSCVAIGAFVLTPAIYFTHKYYSKELGSLLLVASGCMYIYLPGMSMKNQADFELFYFPVLMVTLLLFELEKKKFILLGCSFPFLAYTLRLVYGYDYLPEAFMANDAPYSLMRTVSFYGSGLTSLGLLTIFVNTIRKLSESVYELQTHEGEELKEAQRLGKIGSWKYNIASKEVHWSDQMYALYDLDINDSQPLFEVCRKKIHPDDVDQWDKKFDDCCANGEPFTLQFRVKTIDENKSNYMWVETRARGLVDSDGSVSDVFGTCQDITEAKEAPNKRLDEIQNFLSAAPSCLKVMSKEGALIDINPRGLSFVEAETKASVLDKSVYDLVAESQRQEFIDFNHKICSGERGSLVFEMVGLRGQRRWLETHAAPYVLATGEVCHIAMSNDITEKIEAERDYKRQKSIAAHSARLASIGKLAAGVGHEINNPLAILKGYLTIALRKLENSSGKDVFEMRSYLTKCDKVVSRIENIVNGLRAFSRNDSLIQISFDPLSAIQETYNMIHEIYKKDGFVLNLIYDKTDPSVEVRGNLGNFQQVLMNLIANAKDAVASNEIKEITIRYALKDDQVLIDVQDNGTGVPEDIIDEIFDPFFTTKDVNEGTGIGLSLVHNFTQEMGGDLSVKSEAGRHTTFTINLPRVDAKPAKISQTKIEPESPSKPDS